MRLRGLCAVLATLVCACVPQQSGQHGRTFVDFVSASKAVVRPGHSTPIEFTFHVQNGYHVNSNQPTTPELIPTQLQFPLPGKITIGKIQYPAGTLMSFPFDPNQKLSVYSGDFVIRALVLPSESAAPGEHTIHGELRYQACDNNACYPPRKQPFAFDVRISGKKISTRKR